MGSSNKNTDENGNARRVKRTVRARKRANHVLVVINESGSLQIPNKSIKRSHEDLGSLEQDNPNNIESSAPEGPTIKKSEKYAK